MVYLDNGATTNKKPFKVKWAVIKSLFSKYCANPNRSGYRISSNLASKIIDVREEICKTFNCPSIENVIFTSGCTEALNLAILSSAKKDGHIITSVYEHNSVLRPIYNLQKKGIVTLSILSPDSKGNIDIKSIAEKITPKTYLLCLSHTSNVTGQTNDLEKIGKLCKEKGILFLVDCAQSIGHSKIDMQKNNIDFLTFSGHKGFYSLTGIGALLLSEKAKKVVSPIKFGGTGTKSSSVYQPVDFPDGFESGTSNTTGILSLGAGIKFVNAHQDKINDKISFLSRYFVSRLKELKNITIYPSNNIDCGVISFNVKDYPSNEVSNYLSENYDICVRSGLHCAPLVHKHFGTLDEGMVRVTIGYYNSKKDIDKIINALKKLNI